MGRHPQVAGDAMQRELGAYRIESTAPEAIQSLAQGSRIKFFGK